MNGFFFQGFMLWWKICSVQFSCSVVSDSLWLYGLQHNRPPCPSPTPGFYPNSYTSHWWCHPTISYSAIPCSPCLQSFPASESFPMSQFLSSGQIIGVSASESVLSMNIQDWFPWRLTGWIFLSPRNSQDFSSTTVQSISSLAVSFLYRTILTSIHDYWKKHSLDWKDGPLLAK